MSIADLCKAIVLAAVFAPGVHASDEPAPVLQEVTVTAQKRAESLQTTPVSVTAITTDVIEKLGITNVSDIGMLVPAFSFSQGYLGSTEGHMTIRGIGSPGEEQTTIDSTIGVYLDGVYIARQTLMVMDVVDLERVEVLRGPQGTLFGRNTTGGAVSLISRSPSEQLELAQTAGVSNWGGLNSRTTLHTGDLFGGTIRASLNYMHAQRDGSVDNTDAPDRHDPGAFRNDVARAALRLQPADRVTIDYIFDWAHLRNVASAFQLVAAAPHVAEYLQGSPDLGGTLPVISPRRQDRLALGDRSELISTLLNGHALIATLDFGGSTLKSISSYRENEKDEPAYTMSGFGSNVIGLMLDPETFEFAGIAPIHLYDGGVTRNSGRQFQQELTLFSSGKEAWEWTAGAFYFEESASVVDPQFFTFVLPPMPPDLPMPIGLPLSATTDYDSAAKSVALYGQVGYRPPALDERLGITVGARYTRDERSISQTQPFSQNREASFSEPTGHISLDYRWTPDLNSYLRLSHGYRSGGFNIRVLQNAFKPETINEIELGVKSEWLQKRLRVNAAVYASRYRDRQINRFDTDLNGGAATVIENAGESEYLGGEIEIHALPTNGLSISASFSHVDVDLKEVRAADGSNIAGLYHEVTEGPETTAQIAAEYTFPFVLGSKISARADWSHESGYYFFPRDDENPFNSQIKRGPTDHLNARLRWDDLDLGKSRWRLSTSLWVKNLTNEIYHARGIDFGVLGYAGVIFSEPRTYGMDFTLRF